jgi:hypothetical protein
MLLPQGSEFRESRRCLMVDDKLRDILAPLYGAAPTGGPVPLGYRPEGRANTCPGADPAQIPKTRSELGELLSFTWDLTVRRALELNIPVAGSVSGGYDRRVVVWEWTQYKTLLGNGDAECRYGYVIRFCVTVSKWDVQAKVSLPFLSAQAELGNIQASWMMQVRGVTGPKLNSYILPPQELKVETFVIARQSMEAVIKAVDDPTTQFIPGILVARIDPALPESVYWSAAVQAFGVDCVRRARSRVDAQARLGSGDPADTDLLTEVYGYFGVTDPKQIPGSGPREAAERILRGIRVDK